MLPKSKLSKTNYPKIKHHGAVAGVTGSCHELCLSADKSVLIDCGMFQGAEAAHRGLSDTQIDFPVAHIEALIVTHSHIDHVGRIPYLLAAGFKGPIYATEATARLLPLVIEDAIKVGVTRKVRIIRSIIKRLVSQLRPIAYDVWFIPAELEDLTCRFRVAGHILGSAYVEFKYKDQRITFSGDLGATYTPLLPAPKSPYRADTLVIESTYGDKNHEGRKQRRALLKRTIERCFHNAGTVLIPAFSMGRTQELLYELEEIIHRSKGDWQDIDIIIDSPLAAKFTDHYRALKKLWDAEARSKIKKGRHPLSFKQLTTIDSHAQHNRLVKYLKDSGRPAIVIAASGMCAGGRMQNYLEALLPDERTDVIFVGYQARGTPGRVIQTYGPRGGYVVLSGDRINIAAGIHTISGYSAHADQNNLRQFVKGMRIKPQEIRIVHGDEVAKQTLQRIYQELVPTANVIIPTG